MDDRYKRALLVGAVLMAFGAATAVLRWSGQQKERELLADALKGVSSCLAAGYHAEDAPLVLALRGRQMADASGNLDEHKWPTVCNPSLVALEGVSLDFQGSAEGDALLSTAKKLKEAIANSEPQNLRIYIESLAKLMRDLWTTGAALGVDVSALTSSAATATARVDLATLSFGPPLGSGGVRLERLVNRDGRQMRYAFYDVKTDNLLGYCSITSQVKTSFCVTVPSELQHPATRILGYSEPGRAPLFYGRDADANWFVYDAESGDSLVRGFAGGAWVSHNYGAIVTSDRDRDDELTIVEKRTGGAATRTTLKLDEFDDKVERIADAVVLWGQVLVLTRPDDAVFSITVPLPAAGKPEIAKLGHHRSPTFCRNAGTVGIRLGSETQVYGPDGWTANDDFACAPTPKTLPNLSAVSNGLWFKAPNAKKPALLFDVQLLNGKLLDKPFVTGWSFHTHGVVQLKTSSGVHLLQVDDKGNAHAVPNRLAKLAARE